MSDSPPDPPDRARVTLRIVGPITRSTVGAPNDPERQAIGDALHWIWSWRVQVDRLIESALQEGEAASRLEQRRSFSRTSLDQHLLAVVGRNLLRALDAVRSRLSAGILDEHAQALKLLRDIYEHWDEQRPTFQEPAAPKRRAGAKFVEAFPEGQPWAIVYDKNDWLLGRVLRIQAVSDELEKIEAHLLALSAPQPPNPAPPAT